MVAPDDIFQVSTQDLAGYLSFRPKLLLKAPSCIVNSFKGKNNRVFGAGDMIDYGGAAFVRHDDPYRCNLPDAGGAMQTRCNTGKGTP